MRRRLMLKNESGAAPILPAEYQRVEWIGKKKQSPYINTYINTGIIPGNETGVLYDVALSPYTGDNNTDGVTDNIGERFTFGRYNRGIFLGWYRIFKYYQFSPIALDRITVTLNLFNDRKGTCNGVTFFDYLADRPSNSTPAYLLATNSKSGPYWAAEEERIYRAVYTEGDAVVRNFVPCYRRSDGIIGMYDTVSGTFYTNAGSGTFLKGDDT